MTEFVARRSWTDNRILFWEDFGSTNRTKWL